MAQHAHVQTHTGICNNGWYNGYVDLSILGEVVTEQVCAFKYLDCKILSGYMNMDLEENKII